MMRHECNLFKVERKKQKQWGLRPQQSSRANEKQELHGEQDWEKEYEEWRRREDDY